MKRRDLFAVLGGAMVALRASAAVSAEAGARRVSSAAATRKVRLILSPHSAMGSPPRVITSPAR